MTILVPSVALTGCAELIEELGGSPSALAAAAGLPNPTTWTPGAAVCGEAVALLLELAAEACGTRDFALRLARRRGLQPLGPVYELFRSAATVRDAVAALADHLESHTSAAVAWVAGEALDVTVCFDTRVRGFRDDVQAIELGLAGLALELRRLTDPGWRPATVQFRHSAPSDLRPHRAVFGENVLFDQDCNALTIDRADLRRPLPTAAPRTHNDLLARALAARSATFPGAETERVERALRVALSGRRCDLTAVAAALELAPRTLQGRLAREGASFQAILDGLRIGLASKYLRHSKLSCGQIAELLHFDDSSAFSRFVRAKCGRTASRIRADRRAEAA